jgi:hypothetical protein
MSPTRQQDIVTPACHLVAVRVEAVGEEMSQADRTGKLEIEAQRPGAVEMPQLGAGDRRRDALVSLRLLLI